MRHWNIVYWEDVVEGQDIGSYSTELTPVKVIGGALVATRDTNPIHHDRNFAQSFAMQKDIILNYMHTEGLLCKLATDWSGPTGIVKRCAFRIEAAACPGHTLTVSGKVSRKYIGEEGDGPFAGLRLVELMINAVTQDGPNCNARVTLELPTKAKAIEDTARILAYLAM